MGWLADSLSGPVAVVWALTVLRGEFESELTGSEPIFDWGRAADSEGAEDVADSEGAEDVADSEGAEDVADSEPSADDVMTLGWLPGAAASAAAEAEEGPEAPGSAVAMPGFVITAAPSPATTAPA